MQNIEQEPKAILKKYKKLLLQLDNDKSDRFSKVKKNYKFIDNHNDGITISLKILAFNISSADATDRFNRLET